MLLSLILSQALKNPEKSIPALRHSLQLLTLRYMTPLNIVTAAALVIKCSLLSLICTHINSQIARGDIDSLLPYCLSNHEAVTSASTFSFTTKYVMDPLYQVLLGAAGCCNKTHNQQLSHPCRPSCSRSQASIDCRSVTHHLIDWLNHRPHTTLHPSNYLYNTQPHWLPPHLYPGISPLVYLQNHRSGYVMFVSRCRRQSGKASRPICTATTRWRTRSGSTQSSGTRANGSSIGTHRRSNRRWRCSTRSAASKWRWVYLWCGQGGKLTTTAGWGWQWWLILWSGGR